MARTSLSVRILLRRSPLERPPLLLFFFLMIRRPPSSTLFPYPTLFRSHPVDVELAEPVAREGDLAGAHVRGGFRLFARRERGERGQPGDEVTKRMPGHGRSRVAGGAQVGDRTCDGQAACCGAATGKSQTVAVVSFSGRCSGVQYVPLCGPPATVAMAQGLPAFPLPSHACARSSCRRASRASNNSVDHHRALSKSGTGVGYRDVCHARAVPRLSARPGRAQMRAVVCRPPVFPLLVQPSPRGTT